MTKKPVEYSPGKVGRMLEDQDNCKQELANLQNGLNRLAKDQTVDAETEEFIRGQLIDKITEKKELLKQITAAIYLAKSAVSGGAR